MLQRIHLAILRESERVRRAAKSMQEQQQQEQRQRSGDGREGGDQGLLPVLLGGQEEEEEGDDEGSGGMAAVNGPAVLNMASMRVSLAVLKAVESAEVFIEFCQSLLGLFQVTLCWVFAVDSCPPVLISSTSQTHTKPTNTQACPGHAFAQIQRHRTQRETLCQIRDFAFSVVTRPATTTGARRERDHALALLFGLGVARGSVYDLVEVAALLASKAGEEEGNDDGTAPPLLLARILEVRPFWERLTTYEHQYLLGMINPLEPDGPEILIEAGAGGGAPAIDQSGVRNCGRNCIYGGGYWSFWSTNLTTSHTRLPIRAQAG